MKIGVFGDSFCDKTINNGWWSLLKNYGHDVDCYGEAGSSIIFSAGLIDKNINNYDFIIWALTNSNRISVKLDNHPGYIHYSDPDRYKNFTFTGADQIKNDITLQYYKYILDHDEQNLIGKALVGYFLKYSNVMIIPCFCGPIDNRFNLYELCSREIETSMKTKNVAKIYQTHLDKRPCHLTPENNQIIADLIAKNLKNGIFEADYNYFRYDLDCTAYFEVK